MLTFISIIVAMLSFSLIVLAHEAGHFFAARKNGIFVIEFALGMGPTLVSKKVGETIYSIRAFPIGGFCKMLGEDGEEDDPRAFNNASVLGRFVVIIAGAFMNFVLGILLIMLLVTLNGYATTTVQTAYTDFPAYKAGIREGDRILSVGNRNISVFEDLLFALNFSNGEELRVTTLSGGEIKEYNMTPVKSGSRYVLGVVPDEYAGILGNREGSAPITPARLAETSVKQFGFYVRTTYEALSMLFTGKIGIGELSGFIGIGNVFVTSVEEPINATYDDGNAVPLGLRLQAVVINIISIMVLITINLGIMNLLPLPALDGGRAVFIIIEGIRQKPIDREKEGYIHFVGLMLLLALMVFVTYNDVLRIIR